jgi:hypothetical protein
MAKKQITQLIDDLDGAVIDGGTTIHFSLEGRAYEIDLSGLIAVEGVAAG